MESPVLGEGIFISTDVAKILNLNPYKVRRLINGFWDAYTFGDKRIKAVTFHGLIEFYVYFQCRDKGMSAQSIKRFHTQLCKDLNTKYPFAHYEIRTDFKGMWARVSENYMKADGTMQFDFVPIFTKLERVSYGPDKMATQYYPLKNSINIVVNPQHQFGQPTIAGTNIKTKTIFTLHQGGEKPKFISELYSIPLKKIQDAIYFHKQAA